MPKGLPACDPVGDLTRWRAALSAGSADILTVGDSITEGTGASARENRWSSLLRDIYRSELGIAGGRGYVPVRYKAGPGGGWDTTLTLWASDFGLGHRVVRLDSAGDTATLTFTGTAVDIMFTGSATTGEFTYHIDACGPFTVDTARTTLQSDFVRVLCAGGGSHTLTVEHASGNVYLEGGMVYDGDETDGVRLWDGGRSGATTDQFSTATTPLWETILPHVTPDLLIMCIGTNDWGTSGNSPTVAADNIVDTVNLIRTYAPVSPSVLIVAEYERDPTTATQLAPWSQYVSAILAAAGTLTDCTVLNLHRTFGTIRTAAQNHLGLLSDLIHPSDVGHVLMANLVRQALR